MFLGFLLYQLVSVRLFISDLSYSENLLFNSLNHLDFTQTLVRSFNT